MKRSLLLLIALAGCKSGPQNGFAVDVTVRASSLPSATVGGIKFVHFDVSGAEAWNREYAVDTQLTRGGELRWIYRPGKDTRGALSFVADARDADHLTLARAEGSATLKAGETVVLSLTLAPATPSPDMGGVDLMPLPGKPKGAACVAGVDQCETGFCVDGFCCENGCTDTCLTCKLAGYEGSCVSVPNGAMPTHGSCPVKSPNDPVTPCSTDGTCNGSGSCRLYPKDTVCSASSCVGNVFTPSSVCDGKGACVQPAGYNCDPFVCNSATKSCFGPPCVDNTTCNTGNGRTCMTVGATKSCGLLDNGRSCTDGAQCVSMNCADGVCCDLACTGQCEACDADATKLGQCLPVTGAPHLAGGLRSACTGAGDPGCAGACDPVRNTTNPRAACWYPADGTPCASATCVNNQSTPARTCMGGTCQPATATACPTAPNATGVCVGNMCGLACTGTTANCDGMNGNGCEADLQTNSNHCGTCTRDCTTSGQFCQAGNCTCGSGFKQCASSCIPTADCCGPADCGCSRSAQGDTECTNRNPAKPYGFGCGRDVCTPPIGFANPTYAGCEAVCGINKMCCPNP